MQFFVLKRKLFFILLFCGVLQITAGIFVFSVDNANIQLLKNTVLTQEASRIKVTERADYSTYLNGKYIGLTYRETMFYLIQTEDKKADFPILNFRGESFVLGKTRENLISTASQVDSILPIEFSIDTNPNANTLSEYQREVFTQDYGYPLFRSFPILPNKKLAECKIGEKWSGKSSIAVQPKPEKSATRIPVYAEFSYKGKTKETLIKG